MTSVLLNAEMQLLVEKYGEDAVKEALMKCLEKELQASDCLDE